MANVVVTYVLDLKGSLSSQLDAMKTKLRDVGDAAGVAAKKMQANQLLSQFETVASLLTQVGGNTAKVGIIASSAARPIAILASVTSGATLAAAGLSVAVVALGFGVLKAVSATNSFVASMVSVSRELEASGFLAVGSTANLREYDKATKNLTTSLNLLKVSLAEELAPGFTRATNAATGFVRALGELRDMASEQGIMGILSQLNGKQIATDAVMMGLLGPGFGGQAIGAPGRFDTLYSQLQGGGQPKNEKVGAAFDAEMLAALGMTLTDEQIKADADVVAYRKKLEAAQLKETQEKERAQTKAEADAESLARETEQAYETMQVAVKEAMSKIQDAQDRIAAGSSIAFTAMLEEEEKRTKLAKETARAAEEAAQARAQGVADLGAGIGSGSLSGVVSGGMATAGLATGPIGALIIGLLDVFNDLPGLIDSIVDKAASIIDQFPQIIDQILSNSLPRLIEMLPALLYQVFIGAFIEMPVVILKGVAIAALSIVKAILDLPKKWALEFARTLGDILKGIVGVKGAANAVGGALGIHLGSEAEKKKFLGITLPSLDTGGMIERSGLYFGHKGERVLSPSETRNYSGGNVGAMNFYGVQDVRKMADALRKAQGSYGLGLSLAPYTGV